MCHEHKYGKIIDGYQYCDKCGKARPVGCSHKWLDNGHLKQSNALQGNVFNIIYILRCEKCGDIKKVSING